MAVTYNNTTPKDIKVSLPDSYMIPEQLRHDDYRFIKVSSRSKVPVERGWTVDANYKYNDPELVRWIEHGGNYGVLPRGGLTIIDIDSIPDAEEIGLMQKFNDTMVVQSGSGNGFHIYIKNILYNTRIVFKSKSGSEHMGELYGSGANNFVVGPGSTHPSGGKYEIVRDKPIKFVVNTYLVENLTKKITLAGEKPLHKLAIPNNYSVGNMTNELNLRVEDFLMPLDAKYCANGEIQGAHPIHGSKTGINLAINPSKNIWHCFRHNTGGDPVLAAGVKYGIIECEECVNGQIQSDKYAEIKDRLYVEGYRPVSTQAPKLAITNPQDDIPTPQPEKKIIAPLNPRMTLRLEEDNFIMKYIETMKKRSDGYPEYWFAGALTCLSAAVQRNGYMSFSHTLALYPNVWCFLLGISSVSKKSTAVSFAKEILDQDEINTSRFYNSFSPEGFIDGLVQTPRTFIIVDEVTSLLSSISKKAYMCDMRERFCEVYDCNPIYHKLRKEAFVIKEPYVTQLIATTPSSFEQNADFNNVTSGWFYRYLWFYPNYAKERKRLQQPTPEIMMDIRKLKEELLERWVFFTAKNDDPIVFSLSEEMMEEYNLWVEKIEDELIEKRSDASLSAFSRLTIYAPKLAMLFEVGSVGFTERADEGVVQISDDHMREAMRLIDSYFRPNAEIMINAIEGASTQNVFNKIINVLKSNGYIMDRTSLMRKTRLLAKEMDQYLSTMIHDMCLLEATESVNPDTKRVQQLYRYLGE